MKLKTLIQSIGWTEWRWVFWLALAVIIITSLPLLYGWWATPADYQFTGIHFALPNDWFVFYSYLEQVRQGHWLFTNLFTAEPSQPVFNILWLVVGWLAKIFHLGDVAAFNLARIILIPVFFSVAYVFIGYLFDSIKQRRWVLILLTFSSGLGFLLLNQIIIYPYNFAAGQHHWPMDLWVPEFNTFLTLYYSPHFIASLTLFLATIFLAALAAETKLIRYSFSAGITALVLFSFHPFHVISLLSVILVYYLVLMLEAKKWSWPLFGHYSLLVLLAAPAIIYYLYLVQTDWVIGQKALQNLNFTTPLWLTFFSGGVLLLLALVQTGLILIKKQFSSRNLLLIVWFLVQFVMIYWPVNYQRRMTEGWHFPLVALTALSLFPLSHWWKKKNKSGPKRVFEWRWAFLVLLSLGLVISNLFQLAADFIVYNERRTLAYISQEIIDAALWFKSTDPNSVIFNSSDRIVNIIPAYAGRPVYVGHGVETPAFGPKQTEVAWFFDHNRDQDKEINFLRRRNIDYLFYGPSERALGSYQPETKFYLRATYTNSQVQIYQVL